jgi:hypothetical protein
VTYTAIATLSPLSLRHVTSSQVTINVRVLTPVNLFLQIYYIPSEFFSFVLRDLSAASNSEMSPHQPTILDRGSSKRALETSSSTEDLKRARKDLLGDIFDRRRRLGGTQKSAQSFDAE